MSRMPGPPPLQSETAVRNELFAGAAPPAGYAGPNDQQDMQQMMEQGRRAARDTTATLENALRLANDSAQVAQATNKELVAQRKQLEQMQVQNKEIEEDRKFASRLLVYMQRGFCCWLCCDCCCCNADPDHHRERDWAKGVKQQHKADVRAAGTQPKPSQAPPTVSAPARPRQPGHPSTSYQGAGMGQHAATTQGPGGAFIQEYAQEKARQDQLLSELHATTTALKESAKVMQEEVERQDPLIDNVIAQVDENKAGIMDMNEKTILRRFLPKNYHKQFQKK